MRPIFPLLALALLLAAPLGPALALPDPSGALGDAESGRDAPDELDAPLVVQPGRVYTGTVGATPGDVRDVYGIDVPEGASLTVRFRVNSACHALLAPDGRWLPGDCALYTGERARLTSDEALGGRWRLVVNATGVPDSYRFSIGIDADAPPTGISEGTGLVPGALLSNPPTPLPPVAPATQAGPHVVVAIVDTGINPYHEFFRAPALVDHPSAWLPGFPADAQSVPLTLDAPDLPAALAADDAAWRTLSRGDPNDPLAAPLYTFPGTRVIGAVSFGEYEDATGAASGTEPNPRPVFDEDGHGTHSAGLAAGANMSAPEGNVLVVMVETDDFGAGFAWAASQPWIDLVSVSAGVAANAPVGAAARLAGVETDADVARQAYAADRVTFFASGNGFSDTGIPPDACATYTSDSVGHEWSVRVGAANPDDGSATWWHCIPVDVVARTDVTSVDDDTLQKGEPAGGTSASSPNAAGHYAQLLLEAKRAGLSVSRHEVLQHLLNATDPAAEATRAGATPLHGPLAPLAQGFGLVDEAAVARAKETLLAGDPPRPRPDMDAWRATDRTLQRALWGDGGLFRPPEVTLPQDDAGSGRDATPDAPVPVAPHALHEGTLLGATIDELDAYTFEAAAGERFVFDNLAAVACWNLVAPAGERVALGCLNGRSVIVLAATGTYRLEVDGIQAQRYRFSYTLDDHPPETSLDAAPVPVHDDAGSGRDASPTFPVAVAPGVLHQARMAGPLVDDEDVYTFVAEAGDVLDLAYAGGLVCWEVLAPSGTIRPAGCLGGQTLLEESGPYRLRAYTLHPVAYGFAFTLDGTPPPLAPPDPFALWPGARQDDAGTGDDAPSTFAEAVPLAPGRVYDGWMDPRVYDITDAYRFDADAGDTLRLAIRAPVGVWRVFDPSGAEAALHLAHGDETTQLTLPLDASGTWFLRAEDTSFGAYRLAFTLDGSAPPSLA